MDNLSLGTGIFWGSIALSFVALITATKDKWKWGRIFGVLIGLPLLGLIGILGYEYYESRPKPVTEYLGLKLGMPVADAIFLKGKPSKDHISNDGQRVLHFKGSEGNVYVRSSDGSNISSIAVTGASLGGSLLGIYIDSPVSSFEKKLGEPTDINYVDEVSRMYYYDQYNVFIIAEAGEVTAIGIRQVD